jgi:hypothetical protein
VTRFDDRAFQSENQGLILFLALMILLVGMGLGALMFGLNILANF